MYYTKYLAKQQGIILFNPYKQLFKEAGFCLPFKDAEETVPHSVTQPQSSG